MIDFIGLGAQKSGTSWAYACLYEHPAICAPIKEIHFFSRPRYAEGIDWYEHHFRNCAAGKLRGEFSTSYLYSKEAPARIHEHYPQAKLIAILRNPVERAISQYRNSIKSGEIDEHVSFEQYAAQEPSVREQGKYHEQLERYLALFPREQLLILIYEDIQKEPAAFMQRIYQFLGVDDAFIAPMLNEQVNVARVPKAVAVDRTMHHISEFLRRTGFDRLVHALRRTGLPDLVRSMNTKPAQAPAEANPELIAYFAEDVQRLSTLLDRDLSKEWLT